MLLISKILVTNSFARDIQFRNYVFDLLRFYTRRNLILPKITTLSLRRSRFCYRILTAVGVIYTDTMTCLYIRALPIVVLPLVTILIFIFISWLVYNQWRSLGAVGGSMSPADTRNGVAKSPRLFQLTKKPKSHLKCSAHKKYSRFENLLLF